MHGPKFTRRQTLAMAGAAAAVFLTPGAVHALMPTHVNQDPVLDQPLYDPLTGLPGEQLFMDRIRELEAIDVPTYLGLTVAVIDIENYDCLGPATHHDIAATCAALIIRNRLYRHETLHWDMIARLRDDQFGVLFTTDVHHHVDYNLRTVGRALKLPFRLYHRENVLKPHIGAMRKQAHVHLAPDLIAMARQAAVNARRQGRDGPQFYDAGIVGLHDGFVANV